MLTSLLVKHVHVTVAILDVPHVLGAANHVHDVCGVLALRASEDLDLLDRLHGEVKAFLGLGLALAGLLFTVYITLMIFATMVRDIL